jgi:hypothetical protein
MSMAYTSLGSNSWSSTLCSGEGLFRMTCRQHREGGRGSSSSNELKPHLTLSFSRNGFLWCLCYLAIVLTGSCLGHDA